MAENDTSWSKKCIGSGEKRCAAKLTLLFVNNTAGSKLILLFVPLEKVLDVDLASITNSQKHTRYPASHN